MKKTLKKLLGACVAISIIFGGMTMKVSAHVGSQPHTLDKLSFGTYLNLGGFEYNTKSKKYVASGYVFTSHDVVIFNASTKSKGNTFVEKYDAKYKRTTATVASQMISGNDIVMLGKFTYKPGKVKVVEVDAVYQVTTDNKGNLSFRTMSVTQYKLQQLIKDLESR